MVYVMKNGYYQKVIGIVIDKDDMLQILTEDDLDETD